MRTSFHLHLSSIAIGMLAGAALVAGAAGAYVAGAQSAGGAGLPSDVDAGSRNRLPVVARDSLTDLGKSLYDKNAEDVRTGRSLAGFRGPNGIVLHSPRVAESDLRKNDYLRFDSHLGRRTYEVAVLVTAREMHHQFEWSAHEPAAVQAGVPQAVIDVIKHRRPVAGLDRRDAVLIELGRQVFAHRSASPETFAEALQIFGARDLVDAVSTMGHYAGIAILLNAFDQQLAPGQRPLLPAQ